jgi:hypothetical protein
VVRGASKSSRQMGQLLAAYCWLRMADWSRLMAASLSAQVCSNGRAGTYQDRADVHVACRVDGVCCMAT